MAKGYPDYTPIYGEVLAAKGYSEYFVAYSGDVVGGSYADLLTGTIPPGYNITFQTVVHGANGCEAYHLAALYVNGVFKKAFYFEVNQTFVSPRLLTFVAGDVLLIRLYNYGDSARTFHAFIVGILVSLATELFHPQEDPGKPPKLEPDETLFQVDNPWEGKVWQVVKNIPIPKEGWERHHPPLYLPEGVK